MFALGGAAAWTRRPLWSASAVLVVLLVARAAVVRGLRARTGPGWLTVHASGQWLTLSSRPQGPGALPLAAPAIARGPMLVAGLLAAGGAAVQLVPWPSRGPISLDPAATSRGLLYLLGALVVHLTASTLGASPAAARRLSRNLTWLGLALGLVSLAERASTTYLVYGVFEPEPGGLPFGPFWYRNHFAACAVMLVPAAVRQLSLAIGKPGRPSRARDPFWRRAALRLGSVDALALVTAASALLALLAALFACGSRGGLVALGLGLGVAAIASPARRRLRPALLLAALAALPAFWLGPPAFERFRDTAGDLGARAMAWRASAGLAARYWATGAGLDAFPAAVAADPALAGRLEAIHPLLLRGSHNDFLQLAVEGGVVGLGLGLWAAAAAVAAARGSAWRLAALAGVLFQAWFDFLFEAPAVSLLFALVAARWKDDAR